MTQIPKVIRNVVQNDLCTGCGLCVYKCSSESLEMNWNDDGFLVPVIKSECNNNGFCIDVCPFNLYPNKLLRTENEIYKLFFGSPNKYHPKIGGYIDIYTGYSNKYRLTSSSGGLATFLFSELLDKGYANYIISVKESTKTKDSPFEYSIISNKEDLLSTSQTKYFPVSLDKVLKNIQLLDGSVAIVATACFIKGLRLAQYHEPSLKEKIVFLVGIICGGIKSRYFTEFLASKAGVTKLNIKTPEYRVKDINSTAEDYSFRCKDSESEEVKSIKMKQLGDMWGTGLFKANACDFCDDVTTELADVSLGDAWIEPYNRDGKGTNVVITRSTLAESLLHEGVLKKELLLNSIPPELLISSQQGNFNHRQNGISARISISKLHGKKIPPKRFSKVKTLFEFWIVQFFRMRLRKFSLKIWKEGPPENFDRTIFSYQKKLAFATRIYHYLRKYRTKLKE